VWFVVRTGSGGSRTRQTTETTATVAASPPTLDPSAPREGQVRDAAHLELAA
jgi:hypothetical protein